MRRWILRTESVPQPRYSAVRSLPTAIIGEGGLAQAFADRLREQGGPIQMLDLDNLSLAKASRAIASARRVILLGSSHAYDKLLNVDATVRQRTLEQYMVNILLILQSWVQKLHHSSDISIAELLAVTQMGGDFGISPSRDIRPLGGGITGLLRSLRREIRSLKIKVLDIDAQEPPAAIVDRAISELAVEDGGLEAGYARGRRVVARIIPCPLPDTARPPSWSSLCGESAWVVTGGARGITALCARELGSRFHMHLHLMGTTRYRKISEEWMQRYSADKYGLRSEILAGAAKGGRNPLAAWERTEKEIRLYQTLQEHMDAGVRFTYHRVDVTRAAALDQVLTKIRAAGLPIQGILHGAGVERASTFTRKSLQRVRATFFVKVLGLQHLLALTVSDPLEVVIGFGSVSGRFGGLGQTDYASASELLAKLLSAHRRKTGIRCTTFHWPAWAEVGMSARPESRVALERAGQKLMPTREGISHFIREIEAGLPEAEVVIIDDPSFLDLDHTAVPAACNHLIASSATASAEQPLLECSFVTRENGQRIFEVRFDPLRDPFLVDHQHAGYPLLPAAIGLEALSEAALFDCPEAVPFTIEQPKIHSALRFYRSGEIWTRVLAKAQDGCYQTELRGEFMTPKLRLGEADRCFLSAKVRPEVLGKPPLASRLPPQSITFSEVIYPDSVDRANPQRVYYGPTLQALKRVYSDGTTTWGFLMAPNSQSLRPKRRDIPWRLPVALLDGCLLACGGFAYQFERVYSLPSDFERLVVLRNPEMDSICLVELRFLRRDNRFLHFDFILTDSSGLPVLWAVDLRMIIVGSEEKHDRPHN
jgi:NAD(P)-dependent dehydrogenase (short-subunit alcohol dehydrogenase family)